jgi:hypothetical protein
VPDRRSSHEDCEELLESSHGPFVYAGQAPSIKYLVKQHLPDGDRDPWRDFSTLEDQESDDTNPYKKEIARYHIKLQKDQWADLAPNPVLWLTSDHLTFYTWRMQRKISVYTDPNSAFFPFYLPPGIQATMYHWFHGI